MCWWQRYPHFAALGLGLLAFVAAPARLWVTLAGLAIIASGLIGGFHAGVEYHWWEGITACSKPAVAVDMLDFSTDKLVRCDAAPWTLFGISLAGFNFLISTIGGAAVVALAAYRR
jgi:disulfide bond formation protein DsbB